MRLGAEGPRCHTCGEQTKFEREVPPISETPGVTIFRCDRCDMNGHFYCSGACAQEGQNWICRRLWN
jgi:hypothetical protein